MKLNKGAKKSPSACSTAQAKQDQAVDAVRLLRAINAQGVVVEAGALLGLPHDRAAHLVEYRLAEKARYPAPPYFLDNVTCRFVRDLTDEEMAQILERRVERIEDPDFPQEITLRETFDFGFGRWAPAKPANAEDISALNGLNAQNQLSNRLETARQGMLNIAGTQEHDAGAPLLKEAERFCQQVQNESLPHSVRSQACDRAQEVLGRLTDVIRAGLRRKDIRQERIARTASARAFRSEGGKEAARQLRESLVARNKKLLADRAKLLQGGRVKHEIAGILATRFELTPTQIRSIIKKAKAR